MKGDRLRTSQNSFKLTERRFRLDIRKYFTVRVVRHWNRLPREVVKLSSLEAFDKSVNLVLSNMVLWAFRLTFSGNIQNLSGCFTM